MRQTIDDTLYIVSILLLDEKMKKLNVIRFYTQPLLRQKFIGLLKYSEIFSSHL